MSLLILLPLILAATYLTIKLAKNIIQFAILATILTTLLYFITTVL